ncbi:MAG: hypothetical protein ACI31M_04595 [Bacilli bacterium]
MIGHLLTDSVEKLENSCYIDIIKIGGDKMLRVDFFINELLREIEFASLSIEDLEKR